MTTSFDAQDISSAIQKITDAGEAGKLSQSSAENLRKWLEQAAYRAFVPALLEKIQSEQFEELDSLFWETIPFGTGGRRGRMAELGSATINARTIAESAHGLAVYWKSSSGKQKGRAVVGCDTRNRSLEFAKLTATTLAAHGFHVFYFESHRSTPEVSFAVRHLNCDVGVMISASHNPPSDNGFKAYWSHGGQVLAPHDVGIIREVNRAGEIPEIDFEEAVASGKIEIIGENIDRKYIQTVASLSLSKGREISALFSPLHGVGETSVFAVLQAAGFGDVEILECHREPNGDFPNVDSHLPNPERPEVFNPLIERAQETGAEVLLASDPDADRLGVAVRDQRGRFTILSGNQTGALITDFLLNKAAQAGTLSAEKYVVETLVTTPLIGEIARSHGVRIIDDLLVGFKYIGQTMDAEGPENFIFGAEESLGFLAGTYARDKDAAIAALYVLEHAAELKKQGKTLLDRLAELWVQHGYHAESQRSKVCTGPSGKEQIQRLIQTFRESPPTRLAGIPLASVRDYGEHQVRALPDNVQTEELPSPQGELLFFDSVQTENRFSIAVRPSGTEPKIKFYLFAQGACANSEELTAVRERTDQLMVQLGEDLMTWIDEALGDQ
ncbi:MAG: phospho-sugar mutase [Planctomycetaceae bacterium]